jgi:hypothetical protein
MANENLGPAERIINSLLAYTDHMVHNRPGVVIPDRRFNTGVRWQFVTHKEEGGQKVVYALTKVGKKTTRTRLGVMQPDRSVVENGAKIGDYRPAGYNREAAAWMYRQVAEVWKLDNEFAARWASYAFKNDKNRDLKVILCAFMLVQSRQGDPVKGADGKVEFFDDDFREVGEAMILSDEKGVEHFDAKLLIRVREILSLPEIATINRELGFGRSTRKAPLGRWEKAVTRWLQYRERNPKMLEGLVKAGLRNKVVSLAQQVGYKPDSPNFYRILRWEQNQAKDGHRQLAIGEAVAAGETWEGLTEEQVCQRIMKDKPKWNRLAVMLPKSTGLTRAIMAAAIEAGSVSNKELIILSPTLEELGLLQVQNIRERWERAQREAEDTRAANVAQRMKSKEAQEKLQEAADVAVQKAVAEVVKGMLVYVCIDISGSMTNSIPTAKQYIAQFLQGFPPEQLVVCVFNTVGRIVTIKSPSKAGVENAFAGIQAGGGTDHGSAIRTIAKHRMPTADEDVVMIFIGDGGEIKTFDSSLAVDHIKPMAFGFLQLPGDNSGCITNTAARLGIPCFNIDEGIFADPYAIPRTLRALIAATPVGQAPRTQAAPRVSLVDTIQKTALLKKPAWATVVATA